MHVSTNRSCPLAVFLDLVISLENMALHLVFDKYLINNRELKISLHVK